MGVHEDGRSGEGVTMRNRDMIITASLDQSLLAIQDIEDGNLEAALARAQVAQVLSTLATSQASTRAASAWMEEVTSIGATDPEVTPEESALRQSLVDLQFLAEHPDAASERAENPFDRDPGPRPPRRPVRDTDTPI